jgi:SAM-dependent methyltransferase
LPHAENDEETLLEEQIRYYRARATEYDTTSLPTDGPLAADLERIRSAIRDLVLRGRVLELAAGTGLWTALLVESASTLTAVDASPEMLRLNAAKTRDPRVRHLVSDIFALRPDAAWDSVFFGAWLSHVPEGRFEAFWSLVAGLLAPGGRAVFVDEAAPGLGGEFWLDERSGVTRRELTDGSQYRAVKVLWRPDELEERLRGLGWHAELHHVPPFYWGWAEPEGDGRLRFEPHAE